MEPEARDESRLSRRRLLAGATVAGGLYLAPTMAIRAGAADATCCLPPDMKENTAPGNTFRYADGQLLVDAADDRLVTDYLTTTYPGVVRTGLDEISTVRYEGIPVDVVVLADFLRTTFGAHVNPNHYYRGAPVWQGGPGGPPIPDVPLTLPTAGPGAGVTIGVADTGWYPHPALAAYNIDHTTVVATRDPTRGNSDPLLNCTGGKLLGCQAGHGTFIDSLLLQSVPEARLVVANVLDSSGYGREDEIGLAIARLGAAGSDIVNLSLSGEVDHNLPPVGLVGAFRRLPATTAIVCAAGNHGGKGCCSPLKLTKGRQMFPAALAGTPEFARRVVSVGALATDVPPQIATFSNTNGVTAWSLGQGLVGAFPRGTWLDGRRMPDWVRWRGTSFAAPRVAAAIAEVMSGGRRVPAASAWSRIRATSPTFAGGCVVTP